MTKKIIFLLLFFLSAGLFIKLPSAFASSFTNAYVRLNNQMPNALLAGTVCAQPSSVDAGIENQVTITFPDNFTISANSGNWRANVVRLPSGATIWPGIGSIAKSVSGQSVIFSSGDLTANTLYCFNFSGSSSTTGDIGNDITGEITTENSSNSIIDSSTYAVSIIDSNQISISATVPPAVSDLPISIESTTAGNNFPQDTVLDYTITYGLLTQVDFPLTIQAEWSQGTIAGSPAPSVDILDYVVGSASDAYGSTPAVIDTVNKTITWTISSFPGNTTNQTVTFELKTNNSYTGDQPVSFDVSARAMSTSTVTPDQTVTQDYLYNASLEQTPTPTPTPISTVTLTPEPSTGTTTTTTASPTPASAAFAFSNIDIYALTQSQAQIRVATNKNATTTLAYGVSASNLNQSVVSLTPLQETILTVPNLTPDTTYYFKVTATDSYGNTIRSDIFTFQTAVVSEVVQIDQQSLVVTSNNNFLVNPQAQKATGQLPKNAIVIPYSTNFEIQFSLSKQIPVKSIQAIVQNRNVLGANTFLIPIAEASSNYVDLVQTQPGIYTGRLKSLPKPGFYEIIVRIVDYNGNISEQKISDLTVTTHFMVYNKSDKQGIENAKVLLYLYNPQTRVYDLISPQILPLPNPVYSLDGGTVEIVFPPAKYKAEVSAIGYQPQTIEFTITPQSIYYPAVYLKPVPFNIVNSLQYIAKDFTDAISLNQQYLSELSSSSRLFILLESLTLLAFVVLSFLSFSMRTHVSLPYLPYFFIHKLRQFFGKTNSLLIGKIIDTVAQSPVSKVSVYLTDIHNNKLLAHLTTNRLGEFYFRSANFEELRVAVIKKGFLPTPPIDFSKQDLRKMPLILNIVRDESYVWSIMEYLFLVLENVFGAMLEFLLVFTIIVELYFIPPLGILRVLPFLFLSILNVIMLIFYLYKPRHLILHVPSVKHGFTTA